MVIWKLSNYCSSTEQIRTLRTPRMKLHSTSPLFMEGKKSLKKFVCTPKSCRNFFSSRAVLDSKLSSFSKFSRAVFLPLDGLAETLPSSAKNTFLISLFQKDWYGAPTVRIASRIGGSLHCLRRGHVLPHTTASGQPKRTQVSFTFIACYHPSQHLLTTVIFLIEWKRRRSRLIIYSACKTASQNNMISLLFLWSSIRNLSVKDAKVLIVLEL